jgi:Uncharacterized protein conserved in bacteria (DUF2252)
MVETEASAKVVHLTVAERAAHGKAVRADTPRMSHAVLEPAADRDPVALLRQQEVVRVPELLPIRYGRMLVSPFTFYRGAAIVMAHDLAPTPQLRPEDPALRGLPPHELRRICVTRT